MIPLVILDGHSGSGKTSLRRFLYNEYKSKLIVLDRFTPSNWVYSMIRNINNVEEIEQIERSLDKELVCILVLCECSLEDATRRIMLREDDFKVVEYPLSLEKEYFNIYFEEICLFKNKIKLFTGFSKNQVQLNLVERLTKWL